jgi:hypothetical protein
MERNAGSLDDSTMKSYIRLMLGRPCHADVSSALRSAQSLYLFCAPLPVRYAVRGRSINDKGTVARPAWPRWPTKFPTAYPTERGV